MRDEPSVLLIDDMKTHADYLGMLGLEKLGWTVEAAIDGTAEGATAKAIEAIDAHEGITIVLVDMAWQNDRRDEYSGEIILAKLWHHYRRRWPIRELLIITRESLHSHPRLSALADRLRIPEEDRVLQLTTEEEREALKARLLGIWTSMSAGAKDKGWPPGYRLSRPEKQAAKLNQTHGHPRARL